MDQPVTTSMILPEDLYKRVRDFAKANDRSLGYVVRQALETYLQNEQPEREQADRELERKGKAKGG